jgi:hypothetical protein
VFSVSVVGMLLEIDPGKVSDMHDHDNISDISDISDETPIADAVEQEQEAIPGPASLHHTNPSVEPPLDANAPDWQEQRQEVSDADSDDRDEYRE